LKQSPFQELESLLAAWFQQAGGSGTLLGGRALHNTTRLALLIVPSTSMVLVEKLYQEIAEV
jgi:hypothetical protein